jgi:FkbM family methyltransferase
MLITTLPFGTLQQPKNCKMKPPYEVMLNSIVAGLMTEGNIPNGSIVDAGAQYGRWACYYAAIAPTRVVHAVDPNPKWVAHMRQRYTLRKLPNLQALHGGLSNQSSSVYSRAAARGGSSIHVFTNSDGFPIYTLDELFIAGGMWAGEALGFAHLDVEGLEELVLHGAHTILLRDQPVLTVELTVHKYPMRTRSLLALLDSMGYDTLMVDEIAGNRCDIRNVLCLPRSRRQMQVNSNVLDLGVASRALLFVSPDTVNRTAFPCCVAGGACCPDPEDGCCSHGAVHEWMNKAIRKGGAGADMKFATRTRWYDQTFQVWRPELTPRYHREQLLGLDDLARVGLSASPSVQAVKDARTVHPYGNRHRRRAQLAGKRRKGLS